MMILRSLVLLLAAAAVPATAGDPPVPPDVARVTMLDGWRQADGTHQAAIEFRLAPGWYTYWRVPGASGLPPQFDWAGSGNLAGVTLQWPRPVVFDTAGSPTIGYLDRLVLPVVLTPERIGEPIDVALSVFFGVCDQICVPSEANLTARLLPDAPATVGGPIAAALAEGARTSAQAGITSVTCTLAPGARGFDLTAEIAFRDPPATAQVAVLESDRPEIWIGPPETRLDGRTLVARATLKHYGAKAGPVLDRGGLRVSVLDARRIVDIQGCPAPD